MLRQLDLPRRAILPAGILVRRRVVDNGSQSRINLDALSAAVGDIAEMAQGARNVSDFEVACRNFARLDAVDEISEMRFQQIAGPGGERFLLSIHLPAAAVDDQRPALATEGNRRAASFQTV